MGSEDAEDGVRTRRWLWRTFAASGGVPGLANALFIVGVLVPAAGRASTVALDACEAWGCCDRDWRAEVEQFVRSATWMMCDGYDAGDELMMLDMVMDSRADCELEDAMQEVMLLISDSCAGADSVPLLQTRWESRLVMDVGVGVGRVDRSTRVSTVQDWDVQWRGWLGWSFSQRGGMR